MDDHPNTNSERASQGAPRVYRKGDGSFAVAHDEDGVTWIGRLVILPDARSACARIALDRFEDRLWAVRSALKASIARGDMSVEDAFALYDARVASALGRRFA
jgi:hypothetical protein